MKKSFLLLLFLFSVCAGAAECRKHFQTFVGASEKGEPFFFENKFNNYVITFRYTNPGPAQPPFVFAGMPAPVNLNGFSRYSFTRLIVNGIDSKNLEPKKYEIFNKGNRAGVDVLYNFNGVKMTLRFEMDDTSPLLQMTWIRGKDVPAGAIKNISIAFHVMPCASLEKRNSYCREIVTPRGTLKSPAGVPRKRHKLNAKDSFMILQDGKYQPGKAPKITSPVLLKPDWKTLRSGVAVFGTAQDMSISFELDPSAESWKFGLLDTPKRRNNAAFAAFVKSL